MSDLFNHPPIPPITRAISRNGHGTRRSEVRCCPSCGAEGVRYLRSTGRWRRDAEGESAFAYVTFCAACGHDYGETAAG